MACYDLARYSGSSPVTLKSVAERQGISEAYLEQLIGALRRAGLVRSLRGSQGGYSLARRPEDISVGDIIRVLEGPIGPVECVTGDLEAGEGPPCGRVGCVTRPIWERLRDSMTQVLDSISLADLVADAVKAEADGAGASAP